MAKVVPLSTMKSPAGASDSKSCVSDAIHTSSETASKRKRVGALDKKWSRKVSEDERPKQENGCFLAEGGNLLADTGGERKSLVHNSHSQCSDTVTTSTMSSGDDPSTSKTKIEGVGSCVEKTRKCTGPLSPETAVATALTPTAHETTSSDYVPSSHPTTIQYQGHHLDGTHSSKTAHEPDEEWFHVDTEGQQAHHVSSAPAEPPLSLNTRDAPVQYQRYDSAAVTRTTLSSPPTSILSPISATPGDPNTDSMEPSSETSSQHKGSAPRVNLYSAIGSLERLNHGSFGSLQKRLHSAGSKDFPGPVGKESTLLPPADQKNNSQVKKGPLSVAPNHETVSPLSSAAVHSSSKGKTRGAMGGADRSKFSSALSKASNLRKPDFIDSTDRKSAPTKRTSSRRGAALKKKKKKRPVEMFRPSCDAYTPRIEKKSIKYRTAELLHPVQKMASPMGTLHRPNFRDVLRRVAMLIHRHIVKIERRFETARIHNKRQTKDGLFTESMKELFSESNYCTPTYKCTMVRIPMARPGMVYGLRKIKVSPPIPTEEEIYEFAHQLFKTVQLSSECSIVCLIYVERLMDIGKVPLLATTWRPVFMCGLLMASKVWQDLSSWNIEFANVYPQFSLAAINKLEANFLTKIKWELGISSSRYAKYYFALRSIVEKGDFRQRYNRMVGGVNCVAESEAKKIAERTEQVKEEALLQLSHSM